MLTDAFAPFDQQYDIYCRSLWDPEIQSPKADAFFQGYYMPYAKARNTDGYSLKDYALRNAAWHVSNVLRDIERAGEFRKDYPDQLRKEGFWDHYSSHDAGWPEPMPVNDPVAAADEIKRVARYFGAGDARVCEFDERWMYSRLYTKDLIASDGERTKAPDLPEGLSHVIVVAEPMDADMIRTVPSALSGAATGLGYTHDSITVISVAQYIRNLGYRAYATLNDTALAIPLALQAGMGEVGRNGLLIHPEFGPRFRLGKIFTDMPLHADAPRQFGVPAFCAQCDRCARACPPQALPYDAPSDQVHSKSNIPGVVKWTPNAEKCFSFWANQNSDCIICVRTCPFNRDYRRWYHRLWRALAGSRLRRLALWLDDTFVDRGRRRVNWWWQRTP